MPQDGVDSVVGSQSTAQIKQHMLAADSHEPLEGRKATYMFNSHVGIVGEHF